MNEEYDLYCEFDIDKHMETYINYLEVIIESNGHVLYAVPSHQEKLIMLCCEKLGCDREELFDMCPPEYNFDVMIWLSKICGAISVWNNMTMGYKYTPEQIECLLELKRKKLYIGDIPN